MKIAYVHILPIEYYPPATNAIRALAAEPDVEIAVWTSQNLKGRPAFKLEGVHIERPPFVQSKDHVAKRMLGWLNWYWQCARGLKQYSADVVISIEPHSAMAPWIYYRLLGGRGRLVIHHHEYYATKDYDQHGMRVVKLSRHLENRDLLPRADWISQTNENRLRFMREDQPHVSTDRFFIWPNYPPRTWRADTSAKSSKNGPLQIVYLGSASFHDTFIREAVEWAARFPEEIELTISGYNIEAEVWDWLQEMAFPNIKLMPEGWSYDDLPHQLAKFDVGLILYKGNTVNFVYNAPNKLFEYWACGLEVWYPKEMKQISELANQGSTPPLREIDFGDLEKFTPPISVKPPTKNLVEYSCESALAPLLERLR